MELSDLSGNIIGVVSQKYKNENLSGLVRNIVVNKTSSALKMVGLSDKYLDKNFGDLSIGNQNKVRLARLLSDHNITLIDFSRGLTKRDIDYFKKLFKKISSYGRKIILVDKNAEMFINCVDKLYVINNEILEFDTLFDKKLSEFIDLPYISQFYFKSLNEGVKLNEYKELDDLLKAIYRIKS